MSSQVNYPPKWQKNLANTLGNRAHLLFNNSCVPKAYRILDIKLGFLDDLAIHHAFQ